MPTWEANTDKILSEDGSLTLEVMETYARDLVPKENPRGSRGIARIDYAAGEAINLDWKRAFRSAFQGETDFESDMNVIEIIGSRRTASLVSPIYRVDFGDDKFRPWRPFTQKEAKRFIRMDGFARFNAGCKIGDRVSVRKIDVPIASKIVVTPDYSMRGAFHFIENVGVDQTAVFLRRSLSKRPLTEGDKIMVAVDMGYDDFGKKRTEEASLVIKVNDVFEKNYGSNTNTARVDYFSTIFKINPPTGGGDYAWG